MQEARMCQKEVLPFTAMVMLECTNVGLNTLYKAATLKGLNYHVFMVYSYAIGAIVLLPFCYIFHRKEQLPRFTFGLSARIFFLSIIGYTAQYLGYKGIEYTSPTLAAAMSNITPASTFVCALLFRMEKLAVKRFSSMLKITGAILSIAGALVVVFYKGQVVISSHPSSSPIFAPAISAQANWVAGGALLAVNYILLSLWYIYQANIVKDYPAEIVIVFFCSLFACIMATPVCLISVPNLSALKVKPDVQLISIVYSGIVGAAIGCVVLTWGVHVKGPVYVALFRPLSIAIAAIMGVVFLGDNLYLGSVIGALIVSSGLYFVVWGKAQERTAEESQISSTTMQSSSESAPLLRGHVDSRNNEESA